ncbi:MAG TPA: aldose epimerase, partial [Chitinophagaceae bacterium]|nr:aldose epimerase [Chitinophagaceae bacterium]
TGNSYKMGRHGFAREQVFEVINQSNDSIVFRLTANEVTRKLYPFEFELTITYTLVNHRLSVTYQVANSGNDTLYASIGAHPAFNVPLTSDTTFEEYYLQFEQIENAGIYPLTAAGLLKTEPIPYLQKANAIPLVKSMFYGDALVFKELKSSSISILSTRHEHGITVSYYNMPYMGIWSAKDAPFVCIEPWHGIADSEVASGNITNKEGIVAIPKGECLHCNMRITLF